jgi:hypothetical protein
MLSNVVLSAAVVFELSAAAASAAAASCCGVAAATSDLHWYSSASFVVSTPCAQSSESTAVQEVAVLVTGLLLRIGVQRLQQSLMLHNSEPAMVLCGRRLLLSCINMLITCKELSRHSTFTDVHIMHPKMLLCVNCRRVLQ